MHSITEYKYGTNHSDFYSNESAESIYSNDDNRVGEDKVVHVLDEVSHRENVWRSGQLLKIDQYTRREQYF
jgi:hypothetical protein